MSELFDSIPPERESRYLKKAEQAVNEAVEPVVKGLADLAIFQAENETPGGVIEAAEEITKETGAQIESSHRIGDQAEAYVHERDYKLTDFSTGIGDEIEAYAQNKSFFDQFNNHGPNDEVIKFLEENKFPKLKYRVDLGAKTNVPLTENERRFLEDSTLPPATEIKTQSQ